MQQLKTSHMRYYITQPEAPKNANDYSVIKVKEVDEKNFLEDYGDKVIASGNNLMEALLALQEWTHQQQF